MNEYDVLIVGAGPSGCRTAELVAKKGYDVLVLEEHNSIGKPVQCGGLVSHRIGKLPKDIIVNKIKKARFCCRSEYFEVKSKNPVYVIDREKYDKFRARKAKDSGAKFKLGTRFIGFKDGDIETTKGIFKAKLTVGADGPNSTVGRRSGIKLPENILLALQTRIKSNFDSDTVELWFDSNISSFAWVIPENEEMARVGLMNDKNPNKPFEIFVKKRFGRIKIKDKAGDLIRYGLIKNSVSDNVLLVGDAACQIKPFSGGGLVYGQVGAEHAARACMKAFKSNDFSKRFLSKSYDKEWKSELAMPIRKGLIMKRLFSFISGKPIFFNLIRNLGITKVTSFMDMDFLGKQASGGN